MLLSLQTELQRDLRASINNIYDKITCFEERTNQIEQYLCDVNKAHNTIVDAQDDQAATIHMLHLKIADLEDRSQKVRGVPVSLPPSEIMPYLHHLFCKLISLLSTNDMLIDRAHRIDKQQNLPASLSRNILACVHFFHTKENMRAARSLRSPPKLFAKISLFNDISAATSQAHKALHQSPHRE